jgi:uncharacterized protein (TIGR03790 family)
MTIRHLRLLPITLLCTLACQAHLATGVQPAVAAQPALAAVPLSSRLSATDLAVVVNTADPLSVAIGAYYAAKRHIPRANIAKVSFDPQREEMPAAEFIALKSSIDRQLSPRLQAYALTWARPYRVGCMSVTSACAFGTDEKYCAKGCRVTGRSPYYDASTGKPYDDLHVRPAISIAAMNFADAKALIDRGVRSDGMAPNGTAYLVTTDDFDRSVRTSEYSLAERVAGHELGFEVVRGYAQKYRGDVMFYFTGATTVPEIDSNRFLPGAIADHLTSFGGMLTDSPQMSSLRWLEAGATGSYGTVVEPCNFLGKFPNIAVLMAHYLGGETLIEAYWKSVQMPGQGLFIGEPLAAPFRTRPGAGSGLELGRVPR